MNATAYSVPELLAVLVSRELEDGGIGTIGLADGNDTYTLATGVPAVAAELARRMRCIDFTMQHGPISEPDLVKAPGSLADPDLIGWSSAARMRAEESRDQLRRGKCTVGFTSAAQIDLRGNLNTVRVGPKNRPARRLCGPGCVTDQSTYADSLFVLLRQTPHTFVPQLDFRSALGFGDAPGDRARLGVLGGGPRIVFTDLAVWDFCPRSETLRLRSVHPGTERRALADSIGFDLDIPTELPRTTPPDDEEVRLIREEIDPRFLFLGAARR